jgi:hypothetical protein
MKEIQMTLYELKKKARKAGIVGNGGGWMNIGGKMIQGWSDLAVWLDQVRARLPWNLAEIVDGRRVGVPTLSRKDRLEVAAGLLSHDPVSWRD